MRRVLALLRHARASGPQPDAPLLPEGAEHARALGRRLAAEGWRPVAAFSSPYARALETARIVLAATAPAMVPVLLDDLTPDAEPADALVAVAAHDPRPGTVLVVAHMPLLGRVAHDLLEDDPGFSPGTLVEIDLDGGHRPGRLVRRLGPDDLRSP